MADTPTPFATPRTEPAPAATRVVLGLLGGIGAGKSHVARRILALGSAALIDADAEARVALSAAAKDGSLAATLGEEFVDAGTPLVERIGQQVFEDPALLRKLERLLHPHVHAAIRKVIAEHRAGGDAAVLVIDAPLLVEVGLDRDCDALWYVEVPEDLRLARAERRGMSPEELRRRESFQTPRTRKRARADRIIQNDVDDDALDAQIREGLRALGVAAPSTSARDTSTQELNERDNTN